MCVKCRPHQICFLALCLPPGTCGTALLSSEDHSLNQSATPNSSFGRSWKRRPRNQVTSPSSQNASWGNPVQNPGFLIPSPMPFLIQQPGTASPKMFSGSVEEQACLNCVEGCPRWHPSSACYLWLTLHTGSMSHAQDTSPLSAKCPLLPHFFCPSAVYFLCAKH